MEEVKQLQHDGDFCKEKIGQVQHGLNEELRVDGDGIVVTRLPRGTGGGEHMW